MKRKRSKVRAEKATRTTISDLRRHFGEANYFIFPVAPWYRRHKLDFLAVPKSDPTRLILVRPTRNGNISLRPFCSVTLYGEVRRNLKKRTFLVRVRFSTQLPYETLRLAGWHEYLPRASLQEYRTLSLRC